MDQIIVEATVNAPLEKVWNYYNQPEHVMKWNQASEDWHTTKAESDLRTGGAFMSRMEAKDGSEGFDFGGIYDEVIDQSLVRYSMSDGRKVSVTMSSESEEVTKVVVAFDPETENTRELQQEGWQAILNSFKAYVESN